MGAETQRDWVPRNLVYVGEFSLCTWLAKPGQISIEDVMFRRCKSTELRAISLSLAAQGNEVARWRG